MITPKIMADTAALGAAATLFRALWQVLPRWAVAVASAVLAALVGAPFFVAAMQNLKHMEARRQIMAQLRDQASADSELVTPKSVVMQETNSVAKELLAAYRQ